MNSKYEQMLEHLGSQQPTIEGLAQEMRTELVTESGDADGPQTSERYRQMMTAAEEYFRLLRAPGTPATDLDAAEQRLNELSAMFSDDPTCQALLKLERATKRGVPPAAAPVWSPSLVNRLRGIYTMQVNDGAGLLNGSDTFIRQFDGLPPINEEAANRIEKLEEALQAIVKHQEVIAASMASASVTHLIASRALELGE